MADVKVRYLGSKKGKIVLLPVPFLSLSDKAGEVQFAGNGAVQPMPESDALALVEIAPTLFELVAEEKAKK